MNISEPGREALLGLIQTGFENSIETLSKISRTNWRSEAVSVLTGAKDDFDSILGEDAREYYGVSFSMPGGAFLVLISLSSGQALTGSFIVSSGATDSPRKDLDMDGIAEIANIMVNAVAGPMADACDLGFLISAPEISKGTKEQLFNGALKKFKTGRELYPIMTSVRLVSEPLVSDCTMIIFLNNELIDRLIASLELNS